MYEEHNDKDAHISDIPVKIKTPEFGVRYIM